MSDSPPSAATTTTTTEVTPPPALTVQPPPPEMLKQQPPLLSTLIELSMLSDLLFTSIKESNWSNVRAFLHRKARTILPTTAPEPPASMGPVVLSGAPDASTVVATVVTTAPGPGPDEPPASSPPLRAHPTAALAPGDVSSGESKDEATADTIGADFVWVSQDAVAWRNSKELNDRCLVIFITTPILEYQRLFWC